MVTIEEIRKIAGLAKLSLESDNIGELTADIGEILKFANEVSSVDLSGMDLSENRDIVPLREDAVIPSLPIEKILQNAGESHDGFYVARG